MIIVVNQKRSEILKVNKLIIKEIDGYFHICSVFIKKNLFFCHEEYHTLAIYRFEFGAKNVLKYYAAAIHNGHKVFIFPFDDNIFFESCKNLYMNKYTGKTKLW